ncbi:interaptin [Patella vulgata]|uniref:interaptin n=1 Tax=Patella vulgata TaxID=6465 RepID=UPI0024A83BA9|nr:interaptin [Patella vulgata]
MQSNRNKPRPLGIMRQSLTGLDKTPHLPRLSTDTLFHDSKLDRNYRGIQGNAMSVPPTYIKDISQTPNRDYSDERRKSSSKSTQSELSKSPDPLTKRELRDALNREKDLKQQVTDLLKIIEELRAEIATKDTTISELQDTLQKQESQFKSNLAQEVERHQETKSKLETANQNNKELHLEIEKLKSENEYLLEKIKKEYEKNLTSVIEEKEKEIKIRDDKLVKLKQHMADALKGNSWERQQQLEELTKELAKIQDEADMLRMKIKSVTKTKQGPCHICVESANKLQRALQAIKERDQTIKELKGLAIKFETQLSQQDQLLKMWADEKGHKVKLPK